MPNIDHYVETIDPMSLYNLYLGQYRRSKTEEAEMTTPLPAPKNFTFGADPELFIVDKKGVPVSAAGIIPGTKEEPHKVKQGAVQVDGMAAEFNIDPASSFEEFEDNIETVMAELKTFLPKGYKFLIQPSVEFSEDVFNQAPERAKELGCMPDCNAWSGELNAPPKCEDSPYLRCAGGHIHIGWTNNADLGDIQHIMNCRDLVKQLDWFLGAWSLINDENGKDRRLLYGKAGAFRPKDYGVEYRVLSNFWIKSKELRLETWNRLITAINCMSNLFYPTYVGPSTQKALITAINTSTRDPYLEANYKTPIRTIIGRTSGKTKRTW